MVLLSFVEPDVEARFLAFISADHAHRRDRAGCYTMLLVQLAAVLRLLADAPNTVRTAGADRLGSANSLLWPAAATGVTLGQLILMEWRRQRYMQLRPLLVVPLNLLRAFLAAQVGAELLAHHASDGGSGNPEACVDAQPLTVATMALLMHSGLGAYSLSSLLFPPPYKLFVPSSLALLLALLLLQNPRMCVALCAAAAAPGAGGAPAAISVRLFDILANGMAALRKVQVLRALNCELALFWAQLLVGVVAPSLLLHRQEAAQRRQYSAGAGGGAQSMSAAAPLRGERWGPTLALLCGSGALVTLATSGAWNLWLACMYLQAMHALYLTLS